MLNGSGFFLNIYDVLKLNAKIGDYHMTALVIAVLCCIISVYSILCVLEMCPVKESNLNLIDFKGCKCKNITTLVILTLFVISFIYVSVISTCSPFFTASQGADHTCFYFIGKMWSEGHLPYVDVFDHKGPFIFFLFLIGQLISESFGIFLLQVVALWISLCFAYKMVSDKFNFNCVGFLSVLGILGYLLYVEYGWALTEEFCLPFLMASVYFVSEYFKKYKTKKEHNPIHAGIYGLSFAVAFCTRLTNGITLAIMVSVIVVLLLTNKKFLNLLHNAIGFIIGFLIIFAPFAIYFAVNGALYDMMYGTIIYNIMYAGGSSAQLDLYRVMYYIYRTLPGIILIALSWCLPKIRKNIPLLIMNTLSALVTGYIVTSGNGYGHYSIIMSVFIPMSIFCIPQISDDKKLNFNKKILTSFFCIVAIIPVSVCAINNFTSSANVHEKEKLAMETLKYIKDDRDRVIGYNTYSDFYLHTDIVPCFKYYTWQDWQSSKSETMTNENVEFYKSKKAKWIVIEGGMDNVRLVEVKKTMMENYSYYADVKYSDGVIAYEIYLKND